MSGELSKLVAPKGANRPPKIKARGIAGGSGKTAGRGGKGQTARKSGNVRPGFEGGQMPLQRRLPKRGFKNIFRKRYVEVALEDLNRLEPGVLADGELLRSRGLVKGRFDGVRVLGNGEIKIPITVRVHHATKSAREKIEKAGGKVELVTPRAKWRRSDTRGERRKAKKKGA